MASFSPPSCIEAYICIRPGARWWAFFELLAHAFDGRDRRIAFRMHVGRLEHHLLLRDARPIGNAPASGIVQARRHPHALRFALLSLLLLRDWTFWFLRCIFIRWVTPCVQRLDQPTAGAIRPVSIAMDRPAIAFISTRTTRRPARSGHGSLTCHAYPRKKVRIHAPDVFHADLKPIEMILHRRRGTIGIVILDGWRRRAHAP